MPIRPTMTEVDLVRSDVVLRGTSAGSGPTVLLLHAGGERRRVWAPVSAMLAGTRVRTVAFDLRGHGDSSGEPTTLATVAEDVAAMIHREQAPIAVVGASLGGLAAIAALADPATAGHVTGLMLVDVVPDPSPARVRPWLDERGLRSSGHQHELVEDILRRGPELLATVAAMELPIVLVRGGAASPLSDRDVARLQHANPRVLVTCVPSAGHLVARDAPVELARIIASSVATRFAGDPRLDESGRV